MLYRDRLGGTYEAVNIDELPAGSTNLSAKDFNHDGRTDLAAQPDLLLLNRAGKFQKAAAAPADFATLADFDGQGRLARARIATDGALMLDRDTTPNYGNWIEIALVGVKNLKSAVGAKVEVKAGTLYEKQTYDGVPLVFRLGSQKTVDTVRITWPNGLIQNEMNQPVNKLSVIKEAQRLSGSCPMIFTWDGSRFVFITDVLGVAPLGASSGDGQYFPVDHDEYVSIPGEMLQAARRRLRGPRHRGTARGLLPRPDPAAGPGPSGGYRNRHQRKIQVAAVSRVPPVRRQAARLPAGEARHRAARDLPPRHGRRGGDAHLDLDFGKAAPSNHAVLMLHGWVDWADGSTFLSAMQEHKDLTFPYLQVKDAAGNWKTVVEDMGIPSGKPKTMAVDLTGKFLSASREVRIVTNLCVYWDEIFLVEDDAPPAVRLSTAPVLSADLQFRGFSKPTIHPQRKQPERFDYQTVSATSMWNPTPETTRATAPSRIYCRIRTTAWSSWARATRCGCASALAICRRFPPDGSAISCCWWMAGPRTPTPTRPFRRPCCPCRSTP